MILPYDIICKMGLPEIAQQTYLYKEADFWHVILMNEKAERSATICLTRIKRPLIKLFIKNNKSLHTREPKNLFSIYEFHKIVIPQGLFVSEIGRMEFFGNN